MLIPQSKLPHVGTTIFTVMSALAHSYQAINLSQGFPDFGCSPYLIELVTEAMKKGLNQYAPMIGLAALREQIGEKTQKLYGVVFDPETEITVTSGATEALFAAISAVVRTGDEVIIFEPAYDSYRPAIELNGGIVITIPLTLPTYSIDWQVVAQKISPKTRLIILNTPHNPTGTTLNESDRLAIKHLVDGTDIFLIGDEVYEHIIFDGQLHQSLLREPSLVARSFVISSFGKTYHTTGWKVGYCVAPKELTKEFRKIHQYLTFSTATPLQYALAEFLKMPAHYEELPIFYQTKRDKFVNLVRGSRFSLLKSTGTYFQLLGYEQITDEKDTDFAVRMTKEYGVASIPISVFYSPENSAYQEQKILRFCFAKTDETLERAAERLVKI